MERVLNWDLPWEREFEKIAAIPHGSGQERQLSDYLAAFGRDKGLWTHQDEHCNVIVKKPASPGRENSAPLILQAHMDMVCVKTEGSDHDFTRDPLHLYVQDGKIRARETSLGADDCAGVAVILALLEAEGISHPPLECVFTTGEETGLYGARALDLNLLEGRRMISLDASGVDTAITTTAGGLRIVVTRPFREEKTGDQQVFALRVGGLLGGHSGGSIDKNRGNAVKLPARVLDVLIRGGVDVRLCHLEGGTHDNAIPSSSRCIFCVDRAQAGRTEELAIQAVRDIVHELRFSDPNVRLTLEKAQAEYMLDEEDSRDILRLLYLFPSGMVEKSPVLHDLTLTSLNLGTARMEQGKLWLEVSLRSGEDIAKYELARQVELLCSLLGASSVRDGDYPGFSYREDSPLRALMAEVYSERTGGGRIREIGAHGGCEWGIFSAGLGADVIGLAPVIENCHTTEEAVVRDSFRETYEFLIDMMERMG